MSYYPEHVYFQSATADAHTEPLSPTTTTTDLRKCSVKGCGKDLPPDYNLKMCEVCRGRHRKYAITKRAKRKLEKAAIGAQRIGNEDGRVVTWMPPDHQVSVGPIPEDLESVSNVHVSQIDPRLFNPTSSELAGALTLPPLDSSSETQDAYISTSSPVEGGETTPAAGPSTGQSRYCSVKGCRAVLGSDYLFKMCVPCRDRYRAYGTTKRLKWKRGREIAAQELDRVRAEEDIRRVEQGLPPIGELQADERREWERRALETIPRPAIAQFSPISMLPVRMCTVSHCHIVLQGTYPYRRCERHRLQNRHHSKLKRVRDKEVKSTPFRLEGTQDVEVIETRSKKGKEKVVEPLYTNEPLDLEARELRAQETDSSEPDDLPDENTIPPPARGARRSNTVCSIKSCQNVLDYRSPWKMCEAHREKDRLNRRRKSDREKGIFSEPDEPIAAPSRATSPADDHMGVTVDIELGAETPDLDSDLIDPTPDAATPIPDTQIIFTDPLLPPGETIPVVAPPQQSVQEFSTTLPQDTILVYGPAVPESAVLSEGSTNPTLIGEGGRILNQHPNTGNSTSPEEHAPLQNAAPKRPRLDLHADAWRSTTSSSLASGPASSPPDSTAGSSVRSSAATMASTPSSPATSTTSTAPAPTVSPASSTSPSHMQPQFQVPYYMPPPFSLPYTPGQPPYYVPSPYPPMAYPSRPPYTYGAGAPSPFQGYQYAPPAPGQLSPYPLRPYAYPAWAPYANGPAEVNWFDPNAQANVHTHTQYQNKTRAPRKRARATAGGSMMGQEGLRIVMVQPKVSTSTAPRAAASVAAPSPPPPEKTRPVAPAVSPSQVEAALSEGAAGTSNASVGSHAGSPTTSLEALQTAATRPCSGDTCRKRLQTSAPGSLCERCKVRLKKRQEKMRMRLKLEPRRARAPSRRPES
ncbi:hypothetical protein BC834DRAFT_881619 [Gloeopeniophorella convolvens]|nr:hypothetical protein BC834DRAFT_881619 [Gloeopeniophorella convolvens]